MKIEARSSVDAKYGSETIASCVRENVTRFLADLDGEDVEGLYAMVLAQVERPLIQIAMEKCMYNQSKAAKLLGINRNTLRKKLSNYKIEMPS